MSYRWEPATGTFSQADLDSNDLVRVFETQEEAEEWMTLFYEDLSRFGVVEVILMDEDRVVYGPMPLTA